MSGLAKAVKFSSRVCLCPFSQHEELWVGTDSLSVGTHSHTHVHTYRAHEAHSLHLKDSSFSCVHVQYKWFTLERLTLLCSN